jgi:hypothetical protein
MPLETVGASETILRLLAQYQGLNGVRPDPFRIWDEIVRYKQNGGGYSFYSIASYDSKKPPPEFANDLMRLLRAGLVEQLPNGEVGVTPLGQSVAFGLTVPTSLEPLADAIDKAAEAAHDASIQSTDHS